MFTMNIKMQLSGLCILVIVFVLSCRKRTLETSSGKVFRFLYLATFSCVCLDIISIWTIENAATVPDALVRFLAKAYLVALMLTTLGSTMHISVDIIFVHRSFERTLRIVQTLTSVLCVIILCLPIGIYLEADTHALYTYGAAALSTYVGSLSLILFNCYLIVKYHTCIQTRRCTAIILWMATWAGAAIIQFCNPTILLVGFGSALGVLIIYLQVENPEINLDRESGLFNQTAFYQFMRQVYFDQSHYAALVLVRELRYVKDYARITSIGLVKELLKTKNAYVFLTADDEIVVLLDHSKWETLEPDVLKQTVLGGLNQFRDSAGMDVLYLPDCLLVPTQEDFHALIRYCRRKKLTAYAQDFVYVDQDMVDEMRSENVLFQKIDDAIANDRIQVYFQPIYSTSRKRYVSAEALVRLFEADGTQLPIFASICAAEDSGQIHTIGEMVFQKVCRFIREEQLWQYGIEYVEVNLSAVQCSDTQLAERYIRIMEENGIDPAYVNLEITESAAVETKQTLLENMGRLLEYGVTFSLDDFGTGQSNLNYIVELPVQIVKFDREMTRAYFEDGKGQYVLNAAMHMIHGMEMHIVSEGIETKEQLAKMEELGVDYIQGYYFSRPIPAQEFLALIKEQQGE